MQNIHFVVVLNGPRLNARGFPARGDDPGRFDDARTQKAIAVAKRLERFGEHVVVIPCGDAAPVHGEDLAKMVRLIEAAGLTCRPAQNDGSDTGMSTSGDCQAAAREIRALTQEGVCADRITLVTCWYHGPRARIQLRNALQRVQIADASITVRSVVWGRVLHGLRVLRGEYHGWQDAMHRRPQHSRGPAYGKPGLGSS